MTVEDILFHSARTRLPNDVKAVEVEVIVEEVIELLGLEKVCGCCFGLIGWDLFLSVCLFDLLL
jgi:hypothetical protein